MRFLRLVSAFLVLVGLLLVPSAASAAAELEVTVSGTGRETADSAVYVNTQATKKVSAVSVELTVDGHPVALGGYQNTSGSSDPNWPFAQTWTNGVKVERPLVDLPAKVSVTYESGGTVVVERTLRPLVDVHLSELSYGPTDLGASHGPVTFTGLVTYKKNATESVPAPGAEVRAYGDGFNHTDARTGGNGRFTVATYVHEAGRPTVFVETGRPYSGTFLRGAQPITLANAATRISWSVPHQDDLWVGDSLDVKGLLEWHAPTGEWLPLSWAQYVKVDCGTQTVYRQTKGDGSFRTTFVPTSRCPLNVRFSTNNTAFDAAYSNNFPQVRQHAAFKGLTWPKSPVVYGAAFRLQGHHVGIPGNNPLTYGYGQVFYSSDKKKWSDVTGGVSPDSQGTIVFNPFAYADGYWKVEVYGPDTEQVTLISPLIKVRKRTRFAAVDASPEPVRKGKNLTVRGTLLNEFNNAALRNQKVSIWFRAKGSSTWKQRAVVTTNTKGVFSKAFKATADGYWRATFAGTTPYFPATSGSDYVDVR